MSKVVSLESDRCVLCGHPTSPKLQYTTNGLFRLIYSKSKSSMVCVIDLMFESMAPFSACTRLNSLAVTARSGINLSRSES